MIDGSALKLFFAGVATGFGVLIALLLMSGKAPKQIKQQAYDRGYMVQCIGERGYHWPEHCGNYVE